MTQEEIKMILHQSSEQGVIDKEETEMIRDVFRFSDKRTTTPNLFLFFLNSSKTLFAYKLSGMKRGGRAISRNPDDTQEKVMKIIEEEHYSKYLLVDERKDEIIGVVTHFLHKVVDIH